jgi:caffeoyl-CoA O-methyltransferase
MDFLDAKIEEYVAAHTEKETEVLKKLNRETNAKVLIPRMLSGHLQGRVLSMLSHMIKPKNILEIGTYTGYSAICLSEGMQEDGELTTIDINEELEPMVKRYMKEAGIAKRVNCLIGNATEIIPGLKKTFDLVFIDADKENYSRYYDLVFEKVSPGGYIIADNVLWSGKVIDQEEIQKDLETAAITEFNNKIQEDKRVQNVLFPVRDGLMIIRKKN